MGIGIIVCGLNGAGKSTLGRALAGRLNIPFLDKEDLYFPKTDPDYLYASPRTREEAEALFVRQVAKLNSFVFASVKGDYGDSGIFQYAVLVETPRDVRLRRVRDRSFQKFGIRMLPGGDLYEREERFFRLVEERGEDTVEVWTRELDCPVLRVDGLMPVEENVERIVEWLHFCP